MKKIFAFLAACLAIIASSTPFHVQAVEGEVKEFSVTAHLPFVAKLGYLTSNFTTITSSGVAFNVSDAVASDIDVLVSATVTYQSCDMYSWLIPANCWIPSTEKQHILRYDEFASFEYVYSDPSNAGFPIRSSMDSDYYSLGLTSAIVDAQEETSIGSMVYVITDSVMRSDVATYDYYMIFDQADVYEILLIEISYISKTTAVEEEATCTTGCEFGDGLGSQDLNLGSVMAALTWITENLKYIIMVIAVIAAVSILNAFLGGLGALVTLFGLLFKFIGQGFRLLAIAIKYTFIGLYKLIVFAFKVITFPIWFVIWLKHRHDAKQLTREQLAMRKAREHRRYQKRLER